MKYCRFTHEGQIRYGLVEPVGGEDHITRLLLTAPHQGEGELDELPSRPLRWSNRRRAWAAVPSRSPLSGSVTPPA